MGVDESTYERLLKLSGEPTSEDSLHEIDALVAAQPTAKARLARIQAMLACLRSHHAVEPSASAKSAVARIAAEHANRASNRPGWLQQVQTALAELLFDSRLQPALGLRGDEPGFQLTYEGDFAEVDIDARPEDGGRWLLLGHISPREAILIDEVVLCPLHGDQSVPVDLNERGSFRLALAKARYDLVIRSGERAMLIREIELT